MENTGRILVGLTPTARRILFEPPGDTDMAEELSYITEVDRAHLVMLTECGIIDRNRTRALLKAIADLRRERFTPLHGRPSVRGLFLLYEEYLIDKLGEHTGGILQTARSRNDLNATVFRLRLRGPYLGLMREVLRLLAVLLRQADRHARVVMPIYTHYQAALPITYGHYLAALAMALRRDLTGLLEAGQEMKRCPLGAGAVAGTTLPINTERTAGLLGFEQPSYNSIDAVASRDLALRILASTAVLGTTLSRLATDILNWTTSEFNFLRLPDRLVGSSSLMPQKRNPFLLEHIYGRGASALGAFVAASTAMHGAPFTNSIAVNTEAVVHVWKPLQDVREAAVLARLVIAGAQPQEDVMLKRAVEGYTSATELANRLMSEGNMSFRSAHRKVGKLVREAVERNGEPLDEAAARLLKEDDLGASIGRLDPASIATASEQGGGPGIRAHEKSLRILREAWATHSRQKIKLAQQWHAAQAALDRAVGCILGLGE